MNDVLPVTGQEAAFRATFLSIESIVDRAVNAGVALAVGLYVARGAMDDFLLISAGAAALVTLLVHRMGLRTFLLN